MSFLLYVTRGGKHKALISTFELQTALDLIKTLELAGYVVDMEHVTKWRPKGDKDVPK